MKNEQETQRLERVEVEIGFIPIRCSAPLILAHSRRLFQNTIKEQKAELIVDETRHGGRISIDSAIGQGSRFTLAMPVVGEAERK